MILKTRTKAPYVIVDVREPAEVVNYAYTLNAAKVRMRRLSSITHKIAEVVDGAVTVDEIPESEWRA